MAHQRVEIELESYFPFEFDGTIERHDIGRYAYTVVFLPELLRKHLPLREHPRLRVSGEVFDIPFEGAWQPSHGRWYLMLSKRLLKDGGLKIGDDVVVRFRREDQHAVEVPPPLAAVLRGDADLETAWEQATAGAKRGLAHHVASAKSASTIAKRLDEVGDALRTGRTLRDVIAARRTRKRSN